MDSKTDEKPKINKNYLAKIIDIVLQQEDEKAKKLMVEFDISKEDILNYLEKKKEKSHTIKMKSDVLIENLSNMIDHINSNF